MTMRSWDISGAPGTRCEAIVDLIEEWLESEELLPGDRLPTQRILAARLGVALGTVTRAYAEARRRGLVTSTVGRGTFACEPGDPLPAVPGLGAAPDSPRAIDLASNLPFTLPFEAEALGRTLTELGAEPGFGLAAHPAGLEHLDRWRAAGWRWLARLGLARDGVELQLCGSAQHAILVALTALTRRGDTLLTGTVVYPIVASLAERLGLELVRVPGDEHGPSPAALEAACRRHHPRLLYLCPTFGPLVAGVVPTERREELARVCARHELLVLEDEDDGLLLDDHPVPLQRLLSGQGLFVAETSKSFVTGSRLTFVAAPAGLSQVLGTALRASVWSLPWLPAEVAARWIEDGTAARAAALRLAELERRRGLAAERLAPGRLFGHPAGHSTWLELPRPWSARDLVAAAAVERVAVTPVEAFRTAPTRSEDGVRLCLGAEPWARLDEGLRRVRALLDGPYRSWRASGRR